DISSGVGKALDVARNATETIPIIFVVHGDPIFTGDIKSLAHPGGNITGLCQMHPELSTKQLGVLKQLAPSISRIAVVWNAANPLKLADWEQLRPAAHTLGSRCSLSKFGAPKISTARMPLSGNNVRTHS